MSLEARDWLCAAIALLIAHLAIGCGERDTASVVELMGPLYRLGEADRRRDRGYRPTSLTLPRVSWHEGRWRPVGSLAGRDLASLDGTRVVLDGKMALDESSPHRRVFRLVPPNFNGCLAPHQHGRPGHDHDGPIVEVILPEGKSVQVTDERLRVEGVLEVRERAHAAPRLRMRASAVEPEPDALSRSGAGPRS